MADIPQVLAIYDALVGVALRCWTEKVTYLPLAPRVVELCHHPCRAMQGVLRAIGALNFSPGSGEAGSDLA